ncbi:MAG: CotH kinase family protein [Fimbriimonadaceae bacterium]|nr:CotH kinase family protein [Chitinophagales bacterium]
MLGNFTLFCLLLITQIIFSQTFSSIVNTIIPDAGGVVEFEIEVSGLPDMIDTTFGLESVCLNITHTWDADLEIKIIAPDGTTSILCNGVGGDGDNFENTCFNENAAYSIAVGYPPFTGDYQPTGDMGIINNGQNPNGIWKLTVQDWYGYDEGILIDWNITFGDEPSVPFLFTESNLPIVIMNTGGAEIYDEPKTEANFYIIDNGVGIMNHPTDTIYAYKGKILTELQGYTGPYYPKKNYDFDLIDDSGIEIDTVLLGLPSENDFILKAEYLDYTLMKNALSYEMSRRMGRYAPRTKFVELILNNEYMGIYAITEKIKKDKNRVDIDALTGTEISGDNLTGGYIIEMNINGDYPDWTSDYLPINSATCPFNVEFQMVYPKSDIIQDEQLEYIKNYVDDFEDVLNGDDFLDSITGYRNYISAKSFIDFMIVNEFSTNYDSYGRSTYLYKENITDGGQLNIGPPWDYDRGYAPWATEGWVWEITHDYWPFPFWWSKFREDPEWRNEVYCRYTDLRATTLSLDSFFVFIDSCSAYLEDAAVRNFDRWGELGVTDYSYFIAELKQYMIDRLAWMDEQINLDYVEVPEITFIPEQTADMQFTFTPDLLNADNYVWDFGDGSTSTEKIPTHIYATPGTYDVSLTANYFYGCTTSYNYIVDVVSSIYASDEKTVLIYPNPFSDQIFIQLPENIQSAEITLTNALGDEIIKRKNIGNELIFIPVSNLPSGIYVMQISTPAIQFSEKLIKK